jgi:hypothetical protein
MVSLPILAKSEFYITCWKCSYSFIEGGRMTTSSSFFLFFEGVSTFTCVYLKEVGVYLKNVNIF